MVSQDTIIEYVYWSLPFTIDPANVQGVATTSLDMVVLTVAQDITGGLSLPASNLGGLAPFVNVDVYMTPQCFVSWYQSAIGSNGNSYALIQFLYNTVNGSSSAPGYSSWIAQADAYLTLGGYYWQPWTSSIAGQYSVLQGINSAGITVGGWQQTNGLYCLIRKSQGSAVTINNTGTTTAPLTVAQTTAQNTSVQTSTVAQVTSAQQQATTSEATDTVGSVMAASIGSDIQSVTAPLQAAATQAGIDAGIVTGAAVVTVVVVVATCGYLLLRKK